MTEQKKIQDIFIKNSEKKLVLFIHGIFSSYKQFNNIMRILSDDGYSIYALNLKGHGGNAKDIISIKHDDWIKQVNEKIGELVDKYEEVYLISHSMGALLALNSDHLNKLKKCVMLSPALSPKLSRDIIKLSWHIDDDPCEDEYILYHKETTGVTFTGIYEKACAIKPLIELLRLIRLTKKRLNNIEIPVLIFISNNDEVLRVTGAKKIYDMIKSEDKKIVLLDKSYHSLLDSEEEKMIIKKIIKFINN